MPLVCLAVCENSSLRRSILQAVGTMFSTARTQKLLLVLFLFVGETMWVRLRARATTSGCLQRHGLEALAEQCVFLAFLCFTQSSTYHLSTIPAPCNE